MLIFVKKKEYEKLKDLCKGLKEERIKRNYFDNEFGPVESSIETHIPAIDFIETTQFGCDYSSGLSINDKGDLNG